MRKYELVCIFDPQAGESQFDDLVEKYDSYLKSHGGEVVHVDRWGMRQLAYSSASMKKRRQGYYVLYQFEAEPTIVDPMEEELRIDEHVLRHLVMVMERDFLRVPELVPEKQIIFGPPQRERGGDRGRGRDGRRGDRDGGSRGRRPDAPPQAREGAPASTDGAAAVAATEGAAGDAPAAAEAAPQE